MRKRACNILRKLFTFFLWLIKIVVEVVRFGIMLLFMILKVFLLFVKAAIPE